MSRAVAWRLQAMAAKAHRFHRWAHHPLCGFYAREIVTFAGGTLVCAGCLWSAVGGAIGLLCGLAASLKPIDAELVALGAPALQAVGVTGLWAAARGHSQTYKWLLRAWPTFWVSFGTTLLLAVAMHRPLPRGVWLAQIGFAAAGLVVARRYRRRAPWREPCKRCPQRDDAVCDGWQRIAQRERALHRLSSRVIEKALAQRCVKTR